MAKILRLRGVCNLTGFGGSTVYQKAREGTFPPPVKWGSRFSGWPEFEVEEVNAACIRGATNDELRELVARMVAARKGATLDARIAASRPNASERQA